MGDVFRRGKLYYKYGEDSYDKERQGWVAPPCFYMVNKVTKGYVALTPIKGTLHEDGQYTVVLPCEHLSAECERVNLRSEKAKDQARKEYFEIDDGLKPIPCRFYAKYRII